MRGLRVWSVGGVGGRVMRPFLACERHQDVEFSERVHRVREDGQDCEQYRQAKHTTRVVLRRTGSFVHEEHFNTHIDDILRHTNVVGWFVAELYEDWVKTMLRSGCGWASWVLTVDTCLTPHIRASVYRRRGK